MPDFESSAERDKWIIEHADYFTIIHRQNRQNIRKECNTLAEAETLARRMHLEAGGRYLIYAVSGVHDCYVKGIPEK